MLKELLRQTSCNHQKSYERIELNINYPSLLAVLRPVLDTGLFREDPYIISSGKIESGSTTNELSSPLNIDIKSSRKRNDYLIISSL